VLFFFNAFLSDIIERYAGLYTAESSGESINDETAFLTKWGWYHSIYGAAKGDFLKFGDVAQSNVLEFLTYLTYEKEKSNVEKQRLNKIRNK